MSRVCLLALAALLACARAHDGDHIPRDLRTTFMTILEGDSDCEPLEKECQQLQHCDLGVEKITGADGCKRCKCKQKPCNSTSCASGERCVLKTSLPLDESLEEPLFSSECMSRICSSTLHGCCQDKKTPAHGPDFEGCCLLQPFLCCPDNRKPAEGPHLEGCGCQYALHGCCPDNVTIAQGPDNLGCGCQYTEHGCCPDRLTAASGPNNEGCACKTYQFGCCPDGVTIAKGPEQLGCHCRESKFGCCGDGETPAKSPDSDGCDCASSSHGCCPDGQTKAAGPKFLGCTDSPENKRVQCKQPIEPGSCAGNFSRWGFNSEAHRCEQFIWGGCEGNSNRFSSEAACQMRCAGTQPPQCTQPQEAGNCTEKEALWSFSQSENRCLPFYYSGCGGNDNRFGSREACEQTCPSANVPDKCTLPYKTGECSNYRERWFYDTTFKRCRPFYYGGCGGNENNFATEAECESSCSEVKTIATTNNTVRSVEPQPQPQRPEEQQPRPSTPEKSEFCFNAIDAGPCNNTETRYAYDSELGRCVTFQYGGCGGNQNNFPDEAYCSYYCQPMQDVCQLPMLQGPCEDSLMRWFYDPTTNSCSQFTFGGCVGNDNRFESLEACEARCRTGPAPAPPTTPATTAIANGRTECRVSELLEECRSGGVVWYFDASRRECVSHANQQAGALCRYSGTFPSEEACQRSCGAFQKVDVCKQRMDPGPCQSYVTKFYFEPSTGQCHEFSYGGCLGGANRFSTMEECSQFCKTEIEDPCSLPPEGGNSLSYIRQWYYDASRDQCRQFVYTGCSGNENRFETQSDCEARCKRPVSTTTTVATPPQQQAEEECKTPSSLAPCGNNVTVFYYDSERGQCLVSGFGGCGHANTYSSEEECERRCGAFRGLEVCGAHLDPGPCRVSIPKIYWDAMSASCQLFAYGGCDGGPNRFSSVEECMNVCGDTGPDPVRPYIRISGDNNATVTGELDKPLQVRCLASGFPPPSVRWYRGREGAKELNNDTEYEVRDSVLAIRSLSTDTLGPYTCHAYNGAGASASWVVTVQAYAPPGLLSDHEFFVRRDSEPPSTTTTATTSELSRSPSIVRDNCALPSEPGNCSNFRERWFYDSTIMRCRQFNYGGCGGNDNNFSTEEECNSSCSELGTNTTTPRPAEPQSQTQRPEEQHPRPSDKTDVPAPPQAVPQQEPQVEASEGGAATLRCLFHGNPPPKITWRFGELTIDGNVGSYRLMSDGTLEIHLDVNDPVKVPARIAGDENAVVTGELGQPLHVRCLAYGYPPPSVLWYHGYGGAMVPYNDTMYESKGNILLIRSLAIETLGEYTCQAYNGEGKAASWVVLVRAYEPEGTFMEHEYLVSRNTLATRSVTPPPTTAEMTTTTITSTTEAPRPSFTVPVSTHVSPAFSTLNIGADLRLTCEVDGFPEPDVHWTKDGATLQTDGRITITGTIVSRLTVLLVTVADSGLYACHASNAYSSQSDTAQINVQQLTVPVSCTDNNFFAKCDMIVRRKLCRHKNYPKLCCKSCAEAGQFEPQEADLQADEPLKKE